MDNNVIKHNVDKIKMSEDRKKRIVNNCMNKTILEEEKVGMREKKIRRSTWRMSLTIAAALAICACLTGVTALASTGKLSGFFKNIKNWNGAVVGSSYEQATEELNVNVNVQEDVLQVSVTMVYPEQAPYREIEEFAIREYEILNAQGEVVSTVSQTESEYVADGQMTFKINVGELEEGEYTLLITAFDGSKKADQPLAIRGEWTCEFHR